jgi:dTDP-4-amino-4,6-dideoxygalactose transaminase
MAKKEIANLAFFGGQLTFNQLLHVGRPNIGNRESFLKRVNNMLDQRWLTNNGPYVQELEEKLAEFLGVRHCIAVCNATVALEIAEQALGLKGEVIIPSFTFVATAHSLQWHGITPVFCDIDPVTHNIDIKKLEGLITSRTTGILGVHVWGRACDIEGLTRIVQNFNIKLIFDAAHAFACTHQRRMIGGFGDVEVFSFHATKFFNSFEGGAITTNNDELAKTIRNMRNFGFAGLDNVISVGTNGKMSEISAAMGLTSFESIEEFIEANRNNYLAYAEGLSGIPGLKLVNYDHKEKNNYQYIVIEINEEAAGISRDLLVKILHAENIRARRYFFPGCHQMEPYLSHFRNANLVLPETEKLTHKVLQLPTGTAVGEVEIDQICDLIRYVFSNALAIQDYLAK